ncbi:MAG: hypothetical protein WCF57_01455 [Pyrinomonadaceae bacterium]
MFGRIFSISLVAALLLMPAVRAGAQGKRTQPRDVTQKEQAQEVSAAPSNQTDFTRSAELYKSSLQDLLAVREESAKQAAERLAKLKELYTDGIISRREIELNEKALADAQASADDVRRKIEATDQLIAEASAEAEGAGENVALTSIASDSKVRRVAYFRYNGTTAWSLSAAPKIESFFVNKFGRRLPVSASGQSDLHNRWGYDHREALDVGLHPDSAEGQALMAYLQSAGIPFIAFRRAVAGSATGPHIHIGRPSHKTSAR